MSVKQMSLVWELELSHNHQSILLAYADHADDDGDHVFPSMDRIAWKTGYSVRQVQRITRQLEQSGLMKLAGSRIGGRGKLTYYRLHLEKGVKKSPFLMGDFSERATPQHKTATPETQKGDIALSRKGDSIMSPESSLTIYNHPVTRARARERPVQSHMEAGKEANDTGPDHNEGQTTAHAPPSLPDNSPDEARMDELLKPLLQRLIDHEMPREMTFTEVQANKRRQLQAARLAGLLSTEGDHR